VHFRKILSIIQVGSKKCGVKEGDFLMEHPEFFSIFEALLRYFTHSLYSYTLKNEKIYRVSHLKKWSKIALYFEKIGTKYYQLEELYSYGGN